METFGDRIKHLRKELHLTQVELGKALGLGVTSISKVEAGASNLTEAAIRLICQTYHVNYLWLTEGLGDMMEQETPADMVARLMAGESPLAIRIMQAFAELPMEEWQRLRDMIDKVKREGL